MAARRPLLHLPLAVAACTALYSGTLAVVTAFQAEHDAALAAERAPLVAAAARANSERRATELAVRRASRALDRASAGYSDTAGVAADFDALLAILAARVEDATGAAARLPSSVRLPAAPSSVARVAAPTTQSTTGASGK
ncbi:MAG: hypothetical protein OEW24_06405 [Chloroflexota bacterium]|nr:hypothetical protein [Chloroflexota bacterium]